MSVLSAIPGLVWMAMIKTGVPQNLQHLVILEPELISIVHALHPMWCSAFIDDEAEVSITLVTLDHSHPHVLHYLWDPLVCSGTL